MDLTVGTIVEGKVRSITKYGAFIQLPEGQTGMVHISEITYAYVNDIREHLTEGQDVKAVVISTENGKIGLSIRRTLPPPQKRERPKQAAAPVEKQPQTFDDMVKQFMADSDSKISGLKQYTERKSRNKKW